MTGDDPARKLSTMEDAMLTVRLTRQMEEYVETQVASGSYDDESEVVCAALRLLMREAGTSDHLRRRAALMAALIEGEESGPGEPFDIEAFLAEQATAA